MELIQYVSLGSQTALCNSREVDYETLMLSVLGTIRRDFRILPGCIMGLRYLSPLLGHSFVEGPGCDPCRQPWETPSKRSKKERPTHRSLMALEKYQKRHELWSKLLVSPLVTPVVLPYIMPLFRSLVFSSHWRRGVRLLLQGCLGMSR